MVSYLMQPRVLGLGAAAAGRLVAFYWGGAMVGRLLGAGVLSKVPANRALAICAIGALMLAATSATSTGWLSALAIIAIGLFNAIMFPTIFSLSIDGLGAATPQASGILCMAIVGGAVVPLVAGALADQFNLGFALLAPMACYLWISAYAWLFGAGKAAVGGAQV
jgi:FHS family L-fucose permease-like MFS transporter